ncbi:hypothetical protein LTR95_013468 [Oleoguttula sp. CCFEE 5521]
MPLNGTQSHNMTESANKSCACWATVPVLAYVTWVPNTYTIPWRYTNNGGTITTKIATYDIYQATWGDMAVAFPTIYSSYPWFYSYSGAMPTIVNGSPACTSVNGTVTSLLSSHPPWIGPPPPTMTAPSNDSRGLQYSPSYFTPEHQSTLTDLWRDAFPRSVAYPLHVCKLVSHRPSGFLIHPPAPLTSVTEVIRASSGPLKVSASTTAVTVPTITSASPEIATEMTARSTTTIFTVPQPAASGQKPNGLPQIALPVATTVKQAGNIVSSASSASATDALINVISAVVQQLQSSSIGESTPSAAIGSPEPDVVGPTTSQVAVATIAGHAVIATSSAFALGDKLLTPGVAVTISTGNDAVVASVQTNAVGRTEVVHDDSTVVLSLPTTSASSPSTVVLGDQTTAASSGVFVLQSHTLTPGAVVNTGSQNHPTTAAVLVNAAGETALVVGSHTTTLAAQQPVITPMATIAGHVVNAVGAAQAIVDGTTLRMGSSVTFGSGTAAQILVLQTDSNGKPGIRVGTSTIAMPSGSPIAGAQLSIINPVATVAGHIVNTNGAGNAMVDGTTLKMGSPVTIGSGSIAQVAVLQTGSNGATELVVGSSTIPVPAALSSPAAAAAAILTFAGQTFAISGDEVFVQGHNLSPGESAVLGSGAAVTTVAIHTNAAGQTELAVQGSTTTLRGLATLIGLPSMVFAGQTLTPLANGDLVVAGQTLHPGATVTVGAGSHTTLMAIQTDAAGHTELVIDGSTTVLNSPTPATTYTFAGETITAFENDAVALEGHTLLPGASITLGSGSHTTIAALVTDASGHEELVIGSQTMLLPSPLPTAGEVMLAGDLRLTRASGMATAFVVDGQTLTLGGAPVTVGEGSQTTIVALITDAAGRLGVIEGTQTVMLSSTKGIGGYVISGLMGIGIPAKATGSTTLTSMAGVGAAATSPASGQGGGKVTETNDGPRLEGWAAAVMALACSVAAILAV